MPLLLVVAPPTRCGFESRPASNPCVAARLAQMVERMTLNHVVAGSIPAVGAQRENAKLLSEGRTQAFPWRAPISSFGSGLAGSNWISLRSQWWWLVLTTHSAIALRLPVAWSRVRSLIDKKKRKFIFAAAAGGGTAHPMWVRIPPGL